MLHWIHVEQRITGGVKRDRSLRMLHEKLVQRGFKPDKGEKAYYGFSETYEFTEPIKPPKGIKLSPVRKVVVDFHVRSYRKKGSKDKAALIWTIVQGGREAAKRIETKIILEAPEGDFQKAIEYEVGEGFDVIRAHSWWGRVKKCLKKNCIGQCINALITCAPTSATWPAYLACVAVGCGSCYITCAACASCKCKWWCRYAVGCCKG